MNSFYFLLFAAIVTGCVVGYVTGLTRIFFFMINIAVASMAAYCLSSLVADHIPVDEGWVQPIAFTSVFAISFVISYFLMRYVARFTDQFNKSFLNRAGGTLVGFTLALFSVLSIAQFTNLTTIPPAVSDELKATGINDILTSYAAIVNDKVLPVFQKQPVQVMASKTVDSVIEHGITLSFTTTDYTVNAAMEKEMLQLINNERAKYKLRLLKGDTQLITTARMHSADMFTRGYFSHNTPEGVDPFQRLHALKITYLSAGENLAMAPSIIKAHEGLMRSPGHRANILNPSYGRVGIGIIESPIHGLMITQEFRN